jgi:hypothetical protein
LKPAKWLVVGVAVVSVATLLVDFYFRSAVSVGKDGDRSVVIASHGLLFWRRMVHLAWSISHVRHAGWRAS